MGNFVPVTFKTRLFRLLQPSNSGQKSHRVTQGYPGKAGKISYTAELRGQNAQDVPSAAEQLLGFLVSRLPLFFSLDSKRDALIEE